jgi:hypothetical protein
MGGREEHLRLRVIERDYETGGGLGRPQFGVLDIDQEREEQRGEDVGIAGIRQAAARTRM